MSEGGGVTDWAAVYRSSFADLVRYLHRKVWDEERARDLAQETFARALEGGYGGGPADGDAHEGRESLGPVAGRPGGRAVENPRAWLFRVASNLARDEARSAVRRRRHLTLLRNETAAAEGEVPDPVERLDREARERAARTALEQLSDRDREVLLLWDAGLSYTEIAAHTGLAVGAIGTTLARARRRLVEAHAGLEARHAARS
jgi:RNA polymerase sigma factor (sigma-70 family)